MTNQGYVMLHLRQVEARGGVMTQEDRNVINTKLDLGIDRLGKNPETVRKVFSQFADALKNMGKLDIQEEESQDIQEEESHIGLRALDNLVKKESKK